MSIAEIRKCISTNRYLNAIWLRIIKFRRQYLLRFDTNNCVNATRVPINWIPYREFNEMYGFQDENGKEINEIVSNGDRWWLATLIGDIPPDRTFAPKLSYECTMYGEDSFHIRADNLCEHWVCIRSRDRFPDIYAIEFEYIPHSIFHEQLQIDFAATSLANRHRYVLCFNEYFYYDIVRSGFWGPRLDKKPFSLPLHKSSLIRLEVVKNTFTLLIDHKIVMCKKDSGYKSNGSDSYLLFWNACAKDNVEMQSVDFEIRNFRIFTAQ